MSHHRIGFTVVLVLTAHMAVAANLHVSSSSPTNGPGSAWSNAFHTIEEAIDAAVGGDEVWIAAGVYRPSNDNGFVMKRRVDLYGGFAGDESTRNERDWKANLTVLSGDRDHNDDTNSQGIVESATGYDSTLVGSNSHHVLYCPPTTVASNIVDGLTITAGRGTNGSHGGGICVRNSEWLTLRNCTISGNRAGFGETGQGGAPGGSGGSGGGCYIGGGHGVVEICIVRGNRAGDGGMGGAEAGGAAGGGGGLFPEGGYVTVRNCLVVGNRAGSGGAGSPWGAHGSGGGIQSLHSIALRNCTMTENHAERGGGLSTSGGGSVRNCIIFFNTADTATNWHDEAGSTVLGDHNCTTNDPLFADASAGHYQPRLESTCIGRGAYEAWMTGATDLAGWPRVLGGVDIGAYEYYTSTNYYVSTSGANWYPYNTWERAARSIQDAVDVASDGDSVFVSNGVYATGGALTPGHTLTNRVCVSNAITLCSVNGPDVTTIVGEGPLGASAVRCLYMTNNAVVSGFTLSNGCTHTSDNFYFNQSGAAAFLDRGGILSNCIAVAGESDGYAGGVFCWYGGTVVNCAIKDSKGSSGGGATLWYGGMVRDCTISGNEARGSGGGVLCTFGGTVRNCAISENDVTGSTGGGGGVYLDHGGSVENCTVNGNDAAGSKGGGGVYCDNGGTNRNCVIYANTATVIGANWATMNSVHSFEYCCTTPLPTNNATGCISDDPEFVRAATGDFRLLGTSHCIDVGTNEGWMATGIDLEGKPRIVSGTVDMGALEWSPWIKATATGPGVIDPPGNTWVLPGSNLTYTMMPAPGYLVEEVLVDGGSIGSTRTYTFTNVTEYHNIRVVFMIEADVLYVAANGAHVWPYTNWLTAATNIQTAVDTVPSGRLVLVSNGVYDVGTRGTPGGTSANRLVLTRDVTIRSVNGPAVTVVAGAQAAGGGNGDGAVRCAYMTAGSLEGFTLTNGHTRVTGDADKDRRGGGVHARNAIVRNCVLTGNSADVLGGGASYGTLYNCLLTHNSSVAGGAACFAALINCTLSANTGLDACGGALESALTNCIVYHNTAPVDPNWGSCVLAYCCATPSGGVHCVTAAPGFVDAAREDYGLGRKSPCIDVGLDEKWMRDATDLAGRPRQLNGDAVGQDTVDIGCHEYLNRTADTDGDTMTDGFEDDYGLNPADASDASGNPDNDPHNNVQEFTADTDPRNSNDYFRIAAISNNSPVTVYFDSSSNRVYLLHGRGNLVDGMWHSVPGAGPKSGVGGQDSLSDTNGHSRGPFYRLEVQLP